MAEERGFAGSFQDPSPLARRVSSRLARFVTHPARRRMRDRMHELRRRLLLRPHRVEFFHELEDPYSHLAVQALRPLMDRYELQVVPHLVNPARGPNVPEPELLAAYARRDCGWIAPHYGLQFPQGAAALSPESVQLGQRILARLAGDPSFPEVAVQVGSALWSGNKDALALLAGRFPPLDWSETEAILETGSRRRERKRHYSGGTFLHAGQWYWGVDRLHLLERRLLALGAGGGAHDAPRFDRPPLDPGPQRDDGRLSLEIFPSLRSPYTAVIFDKSLELAKRAGVEAQLRPVMPMVMRGVPATLAKGLYIFLDARREAEALGVPFGRMFDPIGRPVERGFSLWPFARDAGRGAAFLSSFLSAAFAEGIDTGSDAGLRQVVERAGLDWEQAEKHLDQQGWREELEANRVTMYEELGLWGVPSYRLRGPEGEPDLCVWGQDRLWLVAAEIRRRLGSSA